MPRQVDRGFQAYLACQIEGLEKCGIRLSAAMQPPVRQGRSPAEALRAAFADANRVYGAPPQIILVVIPMKVGRRGCICMPQEVVPGVESPCHGAPPLLRVRKHHARSTSYFVLSYDPSGMGLLRMRLRVLRLLRVDGGDVPGHQVGFRCGAGHPESGGGGGKGAYG